MRLIPGKSKVQIELFRGVTLADIMVSAVALVLLALVAISNLPFKFYIAIAVVCIAAFLLVRLDTEPNYVYLLHILRHLGYSRKYSKTETDRMLLRRHRENGSEETFDDVFVEEAAEEIPDGQDMENINAFTDIDGKYIDYDGKYYGAVLEIPPVEFRFFSRSRRNNSIENGLGRVLRNLNSNYGANIVKINRPVDYEAYLKKEYDKLDALRAAYEKGMISEDELKSRVEVMYDRINGLIDICRKNKLVGPVYYVVLFESDKQRLDIQTNAAMSALSMGEMSPRRIADKELAVFLKYTNTIDFDPNEIDKLDPKEYATWAMPHYVEMRPRTTIVDGMLTHNMRVVSYPVVVGDAWLAGVFAYPDTKCVIKCKPMDRSKSIRSIDRSLQELRGQLSATGNDSRQLELATHIETLESLLATLQQDNETLLEVNIYITAYDVAAMDKNAKLKAPERTLRSRITEMKKNVRRTWLEAGVRLNNMEFDQVQAYIGSQISGWDPMTGKGRGIPSNSIAAAFPWIYANVSDEGGIKLGNSSGAPVFVDFFRRDSERVNSNLVIVGKSGSGKSFATKSLLANLAAEDSKIFVLDPENEYTDLAANLNGKYINVGNAQHGRLNPFHIITALDDDEEGAAAGSYATHLQFLEEFFRQILPECDKDALEYLNSLVDRMYINHGITPETNLSKLKPTDYPTFDDLYDSVLAEFQQTDNDYIRSILRILMNYIAKFSAGGRNAGIWNGPSTITTDENFTVFNFQSLLANRNNTVANAQMLLVLKYIDNEIIKNRDYNTKYRLNRKVVVVIDEAHVFIDTKFPVALDFMFQLAKRIRKYNGMQIVITQNIKDFVGSEEIARKSTAIINACQYSMIFALAPNDMDDLCKLYEKAGGINEHEQEEITSAPRGQAFAIMSPSSRTTFKVEAHNQVRALFEENEYQSRYFAGEQGAKNWEEFIGDSREKRRENVVEDADILGLADNTEQERNYVSFVETTEEEQEEAVLVFEEEEDILDEPEVMEEKPEPQIIYREPAPAAESNTEKILSDLLSKFSYDAMMGEIRRSVKAELEKEMAPLVRKAEEAPAPKPLDIPEEKPKDIPEENLFDFGKEEDFDFGEENLFDFGKEEDFDFGEEDILDIPEEESAEPAREEQPEEEDIFDIFGEGEDEDIDFADSQRTDSGEEEESDFDIMELLTAQVETMDEISPIDLMDTRGETVITVSLEELAAYLRKRV